MAVNRPAILNHFFFFFMEEALKCFGLGYLIIITISTVLGMMTNEKNAPYMAKDIFHRLLIREIA